MVASYEHVMSACLYARQKLGTSHVALKKMKVNSSADKERHKVAITAKDEECQLLKTEFEDQMVTIKGTEEKP